MADYTLTVTGRAITLPQGFPSQISNTEGADRVKFNCDSEYSGYALVAVFKNGERGKAYPVAIPADRSYVSIPSAPLKRRGWLYIGLFGVDGLKVLPTLWASPVEIKEGTDTGGIYEEESASLIPGLIERVADVEADVDELETAVDVLEDDIIDLTESVGALEDDVDELEEAVEGKQDTIADLDTIRSGAAAGATALQSVPLATSSTIGGTKINANGYYGIGVDSNGMAYVNRAGNGAITARNNAYTPITPANMDTAFRTCITDPAQELTDEQKAAACATIGAERIGGGNQWKLERTIYCDGSQSQYIVDGLNARALYYTIHSDVTTGKIQVRAYCTINEQSKLVHYHWLAASSGTVMRKSIGRVIREGNMYFSIYASWSTNTNGANLNVCYYNDMNDIITEQPITTVSFGGSIIPEGVTINIYTVEN